MAVVEGYIIRRDNEYLTREFTWMPVTDTTPGWVHTVSGLREKKNDFPQIGMPDTVFAAIYDPDTETEAVGEQVDRDGALILFGWVASVIS